jgi:hypothetical protein
MHFKSLLHVRDHAKVRGRAHHLLSYIAQHVNRHTGEAFDLSVERLADRLEVTPQWVRQLRTRLVETGELIIKQSRGRHPNVYIIPHERCPACQRGNPKVELPVESIPDDSNPQVDAPQPETPPAPTRNSAKPERRSPFWCEAHGFCHSERLSDHRPDCVREK